MTIAHIAVFEHESARVKGLSFHPARTWILAALHTGVIQLWDYRLGHLIATFQEHEGPVRCASFHPTQPLFASGGDDSKIKLWNPHHVTTTASQNPGSEESDVSSTSRSLCTLTGHMDYIRCVTFHQEYPWLLSCGDDQTIRIWNWQSRACLSILTGHNHYVMCAVFGPFGTPSSDLVASASLDQTIRLWDISGLRRKYSTAPGTVQHTIGGSAMDHNRNAGQLDLFSPIDVVTKKVLEGHERGVNWVDFHPYGYQLVSGSDDKQIRLWDILNEDCRSEVLRGHFNNVSSVKFSDDGELILTNSEDKTLKVWTNDHLKTCILTIKRDNDRFWSIAQRQSRSETLFAASHDSGFIVFKLNRERPAYHTITIPVTGLPVQTIYASKGNIMAAELSAISPEKLEAASKDGNMDSLLNITTMASVSRKSNAYSFAPSNLYYNSSDGSLILMYEHNAEGPYFEYYTSLQHNMTEQFTNNSRLSPRSGPSFATPSLKGPARSAAFVNRNRFAILGSEGTSISIYSASQDLPRTLQLPFECKKMHQSANMTNILLIPQDQESRDIVIYDIQLAKVAYKVELAIPSTSVKYVQWSQDRSLVALASKNTLCIYNKQLNKLLAFITCDSAIKSIYWAAIPRSSTTESNVYYNVVLYSTHVHVRYLIPSAASFVQGSKEDQENSSNQDYSEGILYQPDQGTVYLAGLCDYCLFSFDRKRNLVTKCVDLSEIILKAAVENHDLDKMIEIISSGALIGQAIISYLRKKGYPQIALKYVKDPITRFELALECLDTKTALDILLTLTSQKSISNRDQDTHVSIVEKDIDFNDCWKKLAERAMLCGQASIAEIAYEKSNQWTKLVFLLLITGQRTKLSKLANSIAGLATKQHMPTASEDLILCKIFLNDMDGLAKMYHDSGQDLLYTLLVQSRLNSGLPIASEHQDLVAEKLAFFEAKGLDCSPLNIASSLQYASFRENNDNSSIDWLLLGSISDLVIQKQANTTIISTNNTQEEQEKDLHLQMRDLELKGWEEHQSPLARELHQDISQKVINESVIPDVASWGIEDLDDVSTLLSHTSSSQKESMSRDAFSPKSSKESSPHIPDLPSAHIHPWDLASGKSSNPLDHIYTGSFEDAFRLLNRLYGVVNFKPLKELFMRIYQQTRLWIPADGICTGIPPLPEYIVSPSSNTAKFDFLAPEKIRSGPIEQALQYTTQGKFSDALVLFREALYCLFLGAGYDSSNSPQSNRSADIAQCVSYISALMIETTRKTLSSDLPSPKPPGDMSYSEPELKSLKQSFMLLAMFTHASLLPIHKQLALRVALTHSFKYGNFKMAHIFASRLLDLSPTEAVRIQALRLKEACTMEQGIKADQIAVPDYEPLIPFSLCNSDYTPIYHRGPSGMGGDKTLIASCPVCASTYRRDKIAKQGPLTCSVCLLSKISV
jgi:coatomer protein complex subunit alpha (xenin)